MRLKQLETHALFEGVKIGQKEITDTLKNSGDFQMGIEYEFLLPKKSKVEESSSSANNHDRGHTINIVDQANIDKTREFISTYNITNIEGVETEHDNMMEIITERMSIIDGLQHIRHFFQSAKDYGITFPDTAGMHISISHKQAKDIAINHVKFLILLSGDYLNGIFPEREYTRNIGGLLKKVIENSNAKTVKDAEDAIQQSVEDGMLSKKFVSVKLGDYEMMDGRIELRFFGGENYNTMYTDIRNQLLRTMYILSIAMNKSMYRKEYLKQLGKLTSRMNLEITPRSAFNKIDRDEGQLSKQLYQKYMNVISTDAEYSLKYAIDIKRGRFVKGENAIATDAKSSLMYAVSPLYGKRFEKGEDIIATDATYSYLYAKTIIKGRFEKGEEAMKEKLPDDKKEYYKELTGIQL